MRYPDSIPQCGEYLRMTVPFLTQNSMPAHPLNYTLAFEVVSGINEELKQALARLTADGASLTAQQSQQLFDTHVQGGDADRSSEANQKVGEILGATQNIAQEMVDEGAKYQQSLEREAPKLENSVDGAQLQEVIATLVADTRSMRETNQAMSASLAEHLTQIADLREQLTVSRAAAKTDALTGLLNRGAYDDTLRQEVATAHETEQPLSVVMVDIDRFKSINDSMGHLFGDKVIKAVARSITKQTRGQDTSARIGGEEYAVILPDTDFQGAQVVAENIRKAVEKIVLRKATDNEKLATVTLSGGVAQLEFGEDGESLMHRADEALYKAKNGGRNQIVLAMAA